MKKGFTLVELLGVIIILAVIATVAVISIAQSIQKGKKTACLAEEKSIIEAAKTWQTDNPIITANNIYILTMLTNSGYLEKDLKNPMTGKAYKVGTHVKITPAEEEAGNYSYDYKLVYGTGDKACDGTDGENSEEIITVDMPTAEYCKPSLIYTGSSQTLVKEDIIGFTWKQGKTRTNAGSQNVRAVLDGKYTWTDGTTDVKMINCSIAKATPTITLSEASGIIEKGKTKTFTATVKSGASNAKVTGNLNVTSATPSVATASPSGNINIEKANNSVGVTKTETVTAADFGTSKLTLSFTPTDTANYTNAADKTYNVTVRNYVPVPTAANYCNTLTYNGSSQTLVKAATTGFTWTDGTTRTNAGSQNVTATLSNGYMWDDNTTDTKTISCSIAKATPTITLSASSGSAQTGNTVSFTATVKSGATNGSVSGTLNVTSESTGVSTVNPSGNIAITNANNSSGIANTETITGGNTHGDAIITVSFTPSDTTNYNNATSKTYTATSTARSALYVSSSGNDTSGYGTIASPYATVQKAYNQGATTSTIYLMSNVTPTSITTMGSNKTITLTSCTKSGTSCSYSSAYSMIRGSSLTGNVINQTSGTLTLNKITINGNNVAASAAILNNSGILNINSDTIIANGQNSGNGGGVYNSGTLTINSGNLGNNKANNGGALYNTGTAAIKGGSIVQNSAKTSGGGVYNSGTLTMSAGTIGGSDTNKNTATNASSSFGAGIYNSKSLTMTGGSVTYNVSSSKGGGIANIGSSNTFSMTSPANVSYNQSTSHGGGIYCSAGTSTMNSGTVKNNKTKSQFGGGYYLTSSAVLNLKGGNVDYNTAGGGGGGIALGNSSTATTQTKLNMSNGTVSSNSIINTATDGTGGGIHSAANTTISITGGTISSNKAQYGKGHGGALFTSGTATLSGGTIASNTAKGKGGAWFCNKGTCKVSGATIKKNTASTSAGGIYKETNGTYSRTSGYVCKNNSPANSYDVTATSDSHCA